jgi:dolichyl-phosphate beta-glucosyltransferase
MYLSVVIPSYKSASVLRNNIPLLQTHLREKGFEHEIIVVDDGSEDDQLTKKAAEDMGCVFVANPVNMGKGAAVRNGMRHAKGTFRIFTDADIPFNPEAFDRFLHYLDFKEFDMVIGDRTLQQSNYFGEISRARKLGSAWFSFIVGRFVAGGMFDTQCGMKGFRAAIADDLFGVSLINGFAFDVELIYIALKRNYDIKRLPVTLRSQEGSSVSMLRHSFRMVMDLFRIKFNHLRKKYEKA